KIILTNFSIQSLVQPEYHSFFESAYVPICAFSISNTPLSWNAKFFDLSDFYGEKNQAPNFQYAIKNDNKCHWKYNRITTDFLCTPGYIIAYSLPDSALSCFKTSKKLHDVCNLKQGLITGDNERYLRFWHEISYNSFSLNEKRKKTKWFPYQKGGA
ncbi:TPA: SAM-dependent methyltransferase, partial [Escherichia coli]